MTSNQMKIFGVFQQTLEILWKQFSCSLTTSIFFYSSVFVLSVYLRLASFWRVDACIE